MRLGSMDTAVRFAPRLEKEFLPQSKIGMKLQELLGFEIKPFYPKGWLPESWGNFDWELDVILHFNSQH